MAEPVKLINGPIPTGVPRQVVSLVPSITETLFDLGLGERVVGITDYCIFPPGVDRQAQRIGGTKTPNLKKILALHPDLVIANQEENPREVIEAITAAGSTMLLTYPRRVTDALEMIRALGQIFHSGQALTTSRLIEQVVEWTQAANADKPPVRYFCPIWQDLEGEFAPWWMTFNDHTYPADLLALLGGENVFAARIRRYPLAADLERSQAEDPGERDTCYPRVSLAEIKAAQPEIILLPSEPYPYFAEMIPVLQDYLRGTPAVENGRIAAVDGSLITWYGTRLAKALDQLAGLFDPV